MAGWRKKKKVEDELAVEPGGEEAGQDVEGAEGLPSPVPVSQKEEHERAREDLERHPKFSKFQKKGNN